MKHLVGIEILLTSSISATHGLGVATTVTLVLLQECGTSAGAVAIWPVTTLGVLFCPPNRERSDFALLGQ